ncbi:MAG: cobalamin-binding protein [Cellvibrionaceae bacterium]
MRLLAVTLLCFATVAGADVRVEDYLGRTVTLQSPATRIIALAPHIVENVYSAGAGEYLVGAVEYSNYPPEANDLPRIGAFNSFSLEAILALSPDLVITWVSGNGGGVVEQLSGLGIAVYADEPQTLADIARSIQDIGELTGKTAESEAVAGRFLSRLNALENRYSKARRLNVFYQVWNQPLQTVNGDHIITDVLRLCGADNVFSDALSLAPKINIETVLARDPDVILASGAGDEKPQWLDDWKRFPDMQAVRNNHLFFVPPDYIQRHTIRIRHGAERVCEQLEKSR